MAVLITKTNLFQLPLKRCNLLLAAVRDIQSRAQRITEHDALSLSRGDERREVFRLLHRVQLAPVRAVLVVVLRSIYVHVHAPFFKPVE